MMRSTLNRQGDQVDVFIKGEKRAKKTRSSNNGSQLPLLPFGSGGVGLLSLYHSWPEKHNASVGKLPLQIKSEWVQLWSLMRCLYHVQWASGKAYLAGRKELAFVMQQGGIR